MYELGTRFWCLRYIEDIEPYITPSNGHAMRRVLFLCDCGNEFKALFSNVKKGDTKSCGCYNKALTIERNKKSAIHNISRTRLFRIWDSIKRRCNFENDKSYMDYGGRGISVEWKNTLDFKNDMYDSYMRHVEDYGEKNTTIERIDNDGNYSKKNCRWATVKEQANNRRNSRIISCNGMTKTLSQWSGFLKVNYQTLRSALTRGKTFSNIYDKYTR